MSGALMAFLFPPKCIFCGAPMPAGAELAICGQCAGRVPFCAGEYIFGGRALANPHGCDAAIGALAYEGVARAALARYKFAQRPEYGRTFAALLCAKIARVAAAEANARLTAPGAPAHGAAGGTAYGVPACGADAYGAHAYGADAYGAHMRGPAGGTANGAAAGPSLGMGAPASGAAGAAMFDIVACVPLSRARENERGYNQAELMAKLVAAHFGRPFAARLLRRSAGSLRQSGLQRRERLPNARAAFAANLDEAQKAGLGGKRVLLVDDIATTLSTLNACACELKSAGAARVIGAVAASR
ncbi:MAG: hypothetical protein LBJ10_05990 [Clostridiales bacterium]|jgi:predicted amidophosphoribosyltransferase|nr:hypothetical protein [Clostridiales bacterium]